MKSTIFFLVATVVLRGQQAPTPAEDLARVQSEPNLEKRARLALDNAEEALKQAREIYAKGDNDALKSRLEEVQGSVELADNALKQTGKSPSRSPKQFKQAELRTEDLLRKLDGFREQMSLADRKLADEVLAAIQKIHDAWLEGLMGKKK
jgi:predicted nuclease with TOPRIM domain